MAPTSTARDLNAETAVITIDCRLAPSQRAAIRRAVDRRNERFATSTDVLVSRERGTITVTVLPSAVDAADDFGGPAFPTVADVRGADRRAAHREARDLMRAAGVAFDYTVTIR